MVKTIALTGPTGSGKSSVAEALAKGLEKCVNIDTDIVKHMVVSGFFVDEGAPEREEKWDFREWELVGESIGLLANNFIQRGFSVVVSGYIDELGWNELSKFVGFDVKILLLPSLETTITRDKQRSAGSRMGETTVRRHYKHFSTNQFFNNFVKIDTTEMTISDTVNRAKAISHL